MKKICKKCNTEPAIEHYKFCPLCGTSLTELTKQLYVVEKIYKAYVYAHTPEDALGLIETSDYPIYHYSDKESDAVYQVFTNVLDVSDPQTCYPQTHKDEKDITLAEILEKIKKPK